MARAIKLSNNFLSLAGAEAFSKVVTVGAFAYLARVMGLDGFGYIEFAGAVLLCAGLIVDQGFSSYGAREIAKAPESTPVLVAEIVTVRFLLAIGAYIAVVALVLLLDLPPVVTKLLLIYGLSLLAMPLLLQWVFQGHDQMQLVAVLHVIRKTVFAILVFVLVRGTAHIWLVAVAEVASVCSAVAYSIWIYRHRFGGTIQRPSTISKRLFCEGVPIGLSQMFLTVRMFGATVIVGMIASAEDVGLFASAMRIMIALHAFVWLYYFNLLPSLSRAWQESDGTFASLIERSLHGVVWLVVAGGLVWISVAPIALVGVYGQAFAPAAPALQWLAGVCVVLGLSGHYRYGLIAAGRQNAHMVTAGLGAILAMILILVGYNRAGPTGAAIGLFAAEVAVWWGAWWCSRHMLGLKGHARLLIRPLLVAALVSGVLWSPLFSSWIVRTVVGATVFTFLALMSDVQLRDRIGQLVTMNRFWFRKRLNNGTFTIKPAQKDLLP